MAYPLSFKNVTTESMRSVHPVPSLPGTNLVMAGFAPFTTKLSFVLPFHQGMAYRLPMMSLPSYVIFPFEMAKALLMVFSSLPFSDLPWVFVDFMSLMFLSPFAEMLAVYGMESVHISIVTRGVVTDSMASLCATSIVGLLDAVMFLLYT